MKRLTKVNNTPEHWDEQYVDSPDRSWSVFLNLLVAHQVLPDKSVVDFGCGRGFLLEAINVSREDHGELYGIDYSEEGINKARDRVPQAQFMVGDVSDVPMPDDYFDYAVSVEVLEHLDKPEEMVREMSRVLGRSGTALLTTPWRNLAPSPQHMWSFEVEDIKKMFYKYFADVHVITMASSRGVYRKYDDGSVSWNIPPGTIDTIFVRATK